MNIEQVIEEWSDIEESEDSDVSSDSEESEDEDSDEEVVCWREARGKRSFSIAVNRNRVILS